MKNRKPQGKRKNFRSDTSLRNDWQEASASASLDNGDGGTRYCEACTVEGWLARDVADIKQPNGADRVVDSAKVWAARPVHTCGLRLMTAAESELVRVTLLWWRDTTAHRNGCRCEFCMNVRAVEAVRSERQAKP